jgi:hypothetical protein
MALCGDLTVQWYVRFFAPCPLCLFEKPKTEHGFGYFKPILGFSCTKMLAAAVKKSPRPAVVSGILSRLWAFSGTAGPAAAVEKAQSRAWFWVFQADFGLFAQQNLHLCVQKKPKDGAGFGYFEAIPGFFWHDRASCCR